MQDTIEELGEYRASQEKLALIKKEVLDWLHGKLRTMDDAGQRPQIPLDTLIQDVSEKWLIPPRDALTVLLGVVDACDTMFCDRVVIGMKWRMQWCSHPGCKTRYSTALRACPDAKMHREAAP